MAGKGAPKKALTKREPTQVRFEDATLVELKVIAKRNRWSLSSTVRYVVEDAIKAGIIR